MKTPPIPVFRKLKAEEAPVPAPRAIAVPDKPDESAISDAELQVRLELAQLVHETRVLNEHAAYYRRLLATLGEERAQAQLLYERTIADIDARELDAQAELQRLKPMQAKVRMRRLRATQRQTRQTKQEK